MRMNIVSQRVLALHELLLQIMAEADLATCVSAAGVCQSWYEIAVGEIWRSLPSPVPLFSILAPLVCERGSYGQVSVDFAVYFSNCLPKALSVFKLQSSLGDGRDFSRCRVMFGPSNIGTTRVNSPFTPLYST